MIVPSARPTLKEQNAAAQCTSLEGAVVWFSAVRAATERLCCDDVKMHCLSSLEDTFLTKAISHHERQANRIPCLVLTFE